MIVAVIGSRSFSDYKLLEETLESISGISQIVSGGSKGADSLAEEYAEQRQISMVIIKPDWKQYGKGAGIVRNRKIIETVEMVVAFWDGKSKGTASSLKMAKSKWIPILTVKIP